jgi:hypothetical protein
MLFSFSVNLTEAIDLEIAELEKRFKQDMDDLLRAKAYALRKSVPNITSEATISTTTGPLPNGRIRPTRDGIKTDRQIQREFLAGWPGTFTIKDLINAAKRHEGSPAAAFELNDWASTINWLCQNKFVEAVEKREGKTPGIYRVIVSKTDLISPKRRKTDRVNALQDIVIESIKNLSKHRFDKNDVISEVHKNHPDRAADVIGAVLHRLAANNVAARIFAKSREGNVYEKL